MKLSYNAQGQRVKKQIGSQPAVYYAYDLQGQLLGEYTLNGTQYKPVIEYIWLEDQPVAAVRPTPGAPANTGNSAQEVFYLHTDHLGTPRIALDTAGRVRWRWMGGEPFGVNPAENNPEGLGELNLSLRLPGQQYDGFVGLHYNYFRDYDPTVGRYTQSDPIGLAGGINPYNYVDGAPTMYTDPEGLQAIPVPPPIIPGVPTPGRPSPRPVDPTDPGGPQYTPVPSPSLPDWLKRILPKSALERCEADCDAKYDDDQKYCEAHWKMHGRNPEAYRMCMSGARKRYVQCYQDCKKECEK